MRSGSRLRASTWPLSIIGRHQNRSAFFKTLRSGLVIGLYNQKELWPLFGYEGSSADKGGYIERGFDDLTWL